MKELHNFFKNKKVLILGFGLEGKSTLKLLEDLPCEIIIADKNPEAVKNLSYEVCAGEDYLNAMYDYEVDIIMKSPGIPLLGEIPSQIKEKITCQTDLFLRFSESKIVGITGTKGKSTVSSLIYHILKNCGKSAELIGNIGVPPLEFFTKPNYQTSIAVSELSCHQLEYVKASPDIAIYLNLYEEHLDHYNSFADYRAAKENIYLYQKSGDLLVHLDELTSEKLRTSKGEKLSISYAETFENNVKTHLPGKHNQYNIAVALAVCEYLGCDKKEALRAIESFTGLPHRLELAEIIKGVKYINDSISTIPKAAVNAVLAFPETDTLIIGGLDRGINYSELIAFLEKNGIINVIALPDSGHKIVDLIPGRPNIYRASNMQDAVNHAVKVTRQCCILSPAAASYGFYKNFEERGNHFKELLKLYL